MTLEWRDVWALYCPEINRKVLDECKWLQNTICSWPSEDTSPVDVCDWFADLYSPSAIDLHRKGLGQFFTPSTVARFMASLFDPFESDARILEPGAGFGILIAALAERVVYDGHCRNLNAIAYEIDPNLRPALTLVLGYMRHWLAERQIHFVFEIRSEDFILGNISVLRPAPLLDSKLTQLCPDVIISNPPYFKIPKNDPRVALLPEVVHGQPNIYALFVAASAKILKSDGQMIFITPRSFCSGSYFRQLRKWLFSTVSLERLHAFESRTDAFARDAVLQENVIFKARKVSSWRNIIEISSSQGASDLKRVTVRSVPLAEIVDIDSQDAILSIPLELSDIPIRKIFRQWPDRLNSLGLEISTGPVVPFRTLELTDKGDGITTAPLIWLQHVQRMATIWPIVSLDKPHWVQIKANTKQLLLLNQNYVLMRRFSPKEENSRIVAAPYLKDSLPSEFLGIENHVNYLHRPKGRLSEIEAIGLAAIFNSKWVDQYFRISSGNTQVSASEMRALPMPSIDKIQRIGTRLKEAGETGRVALVNQIVGEELELPLDSTNGNGGHMTKIEEAKDLLKLTGLPPAQHNELAALTLLAVANLTEPDAWKKAQRRSIRIHDMIAFVEQNYRKRYAENTRETFRRQVLHQFEQAQIIERNSDDPTLPTNSPRTHYAISESFLPVMQNYGTKTGERLLREFSKQQGKLIEVYQKRRDLNLIPVKDSAGKVYHLSPGKHNELQVAVIEQFAPRFARHADLLYMGDTANKALIMDAAKLKHLGFPADKHSKLPDVVLYLPKKKWLYLIEVVTSHGPVSPKRYKEVEAMFSKSKVARIYVSVFPDLKEYVRHSRNIAWETEVWIAEAPDHMIHFNGEKFLGPYHQRKL